MNILLEHANLHVTDIKAMTDFFLTALPDFRVRHDTGTEEPERWVHIGTEQQYLALYQAHRPALPGRQRYSDSPGINHLGFVVDDVTALSRRMHAGGYRETTIPNQHPARKRVYFEDPEGNEWEFLEYLTEDNSRRNDYSL